MVLNKQCCVGKGGGEVCYHGERKERWVCRRVVVPPSPVRPSVLYCTMLGHELVSAAAARRAPTYLPSMLGRRYKG